MRKLIPILIFVFSVSTHLFAQKIRRENLPQDSLFQANRSIINTSLAKPLGFLENLEINGYYRFIANYRHLSETYSHLAANRNNIFVGDDSQIPQLMLNLRGYASSKVSFGADLFLWTPMTGAGEIENVKGLNLGVNLSGMFSTDLGNFTVKTGGINWYTLSPFTFQSNKGYNRYSLFERNPWDPNTSLVDTRYSNFYTSGAINQDQRWGNQAFHGLIVEGAQLPHQMSFSAMFGKTQFDGGMSPIPNTSFGGRLSKSIAMSKGLFSINTFNNNSLLDSLGKQKAGFNILTGEIQFENKNFKLFSEIGIGRRYAGLTNGNWGEAISVKVSSNLAKRFPTELHVFRISPNVFNNSSVFINSSIQQTTQTLAGQTQAVLIPVASALLPVGQLTNNRQGIEINTQVDFGKLKNSIGYSNAMELQALSPQVTYTHAFNNLALSRFWRWDFPSAVGPYGNLNKIYRSVFEIMTLTDLNADGKPKFKKYFNTLELNSKYKTTLAKKELYLFYLGSINSVQNSAAPFTVLTEKALMRAYYHQLESYWKIGSRLVWTNYASFERIIANYQTKVDTDSKRPKNQKGYSLATGFDIHLSKGVGLYIRERWMKYEDMSFAKDRYKGWETTVELKAFF